MTPAAFIPPHAFEPTRALASWTFEQITPAWFWLGLLLACVGVLALVYAGIYRRSGRRLTWTLFSMRLLGVLALLAALVKPAYEHIQQESEPPAIAVIVDDSQSMSLSHPDPTADGSATTDPPWRPRFELARRWLSDSPIGQQLDDRYDVHLFDIEGRPLTDNRLPEQPVAEQTDLVGALRAVATQMRAHHTAAVVMLSDGRDTSGRERLEALESYPLPVHTISFTPPPRPADAAPRVEVVEVEPPGRVLAHHTAHVEVLLRKEAGPALDVPVRIERGEALFAQTIASLPEGRAERLVNVPVTPEAPGDYVLSARIGRDAEALAPTASELFRLRVDAEPMRVLYIEGVLRPEARFLRQRLRDDPDIDLVSFFRAASPGRDAAAAISAELLDADRLDEIDVVLLGDFETAMLDPDVYQRLRDWLEQGGGLMVLGGYTNLGAHGLADTPLADVLPVSLDTADTDQIDQPLRFEPTLSGAAHPVLRLTGDPGRDREQWARLPELAGVVATGPARAGAEVLARHHAPNPAHPEQRGHIVLASNPFDQGRAMLLTADTTWRWSRLARMRGEPDTLYARFWSQTIRWLAQREEDDTRPPLNVSTDRVAYERGQRVEVHVRRNPASDVPQAEPTEHATTPSDTNDAPPGGLQVRVRRPDGRTTPLRARPDPADPQIWHAHHYPDQGGRYRVEVGWHEHDDPDRPGGANEVSEFVVAGSELELADPTPNPTALRRIARLTGGVHSPIEAADAGERALALTSDEPRLRHHHRKVHYWNSPLLFLLFLALISSEWLLRRWNKLVYWQTQN